MKGTAHIRFMRPGMLRVSGRSMFGSEYDMVSNGKTTEVNAGGTWEPQPSAELGIAAITGISGNAGTYVPTTLVHASYVSISTLMPDAKVTKETVNDVPTFHAKLRGPASVDFWINAKTYFIVKSSMTVGTTSIVVIYDTPLVNYPIPVKVFKKS